MVRYSVVLLTFFFCLSVHGQEKLDFPKWRIGITPSALLYDFQGIQFSLDRSFNENINLSAEYGRIIPSSQNKGGARLHAGLEVILAKGRWISYISGVHFTHIATLGQQKITTRARNREFNFVRYQEVQNNFNAISISNSVLMKIGKRIYVSLGAGIGSGRKQFNAPWKDSKVTAPSALYYIDFNISYAFGL